MVVFPFGHSFVSAEHVTSAQIPSTQRRLDRRRDKTHTSTSPQTRFQTARSPSSPHPRGSSLGLQTQRPTMGNCRSRTLNCCRLLRRNEGSLRLRRWRARTMRRCWSRSQGTRGIAACCRIRGAGTGPREYNRHRLSAGTSWYARCVRVSRREHDRGGALVLLWEEGVSVCGVV